MPYIWPWPKGTVASQEFGTNPGGVNPAGGHTGLDAALPVGTPLRAPCDGVVVFEGWANLNNNPFLLTDGGGICLVIDAGDGQPAFVMGHLSETMVSGGDRVKQGQIVAKSGNTGKWTTGPHVHLEALPPVYSLNTNTYGRVNPRNYCTAYFEDLQQPGTINYAGGGAVLGTEGVAIRKVTTEGANVRINPWSWSGKVPGYEDGLALGAQLAVIGYVKGQEVTPGNDAWYKTKSGYYVWANAAEDNITGLPFLGAMAVPPAPAPAPEPAPTPAPVETPKYDFELDFTVINGITVEKIPAHWDNYGEDFPDKPAKAVLHWWNKLSARPDIASVIGEFCYRSTGKSPHFIVSDERMIQSVSLKDRAFHAGRGGNDWVGIEIDPRAIEKNPDGSYTARALRIQANVRGLLQALKDKFGYKLSLTLHKDVPEANTACSDLVLADFNIPDVAVPPVVVIEPSDPEEMDAETIRKLIRWLTSLLETKE